jgi:hypothetical protein
MLIMSNTILIDQQVLKSLKNDALRLVERIEKLEEQESANKARESAALLIQEMAQDANLSEAEADRVASEAVQAVREQYRLR